MTILSTLRRFVPPYKGFVTLNIFFNVLSTILSLFSFATLIPVLQLLFGLTVAKVTHIPFSEAQGLEELLAVAKNNFYVVLQSPEKRPHYTIVNVLTEHYYFTTLQRRSQQ